MTANDDSREDDPGNRDRRDYPPASSLNHVKMIHVCFRVFCQDATAKSSVGSTLVLDQGDFLHVGQCTRMPHTLNPPGERTSAEGFRGARLAGSLLLEPGTQG